MERYNGSSFGNNKLYASVGTERYMDKLSSYYARCNEHTPPFFRKLRKAGLMLAAAGTALIVSPIALPALVGTVGGYFIVAGAVASAVSQAAIDPASPSRETYRPEPECDFWGAKTQKI
jgi:hypothetical protein